MAKTKADMGKNADEETLPLAKPGMKYEEEPIPTAKPSTKDKMEPLPLAKPKDPMQKYRNGGYVRSADGCAKRGKTRGRIV